MLGRILGLFLFILIWLGYVALCFHLGSISLLTIGGIMTLIGLIILFFALIVVSLIIYWVA